MPHILVSNLMKTLAVLIATLVGVSLIEAYQNERSVVFFQDALPRTVIPNIVVGGETYQVVHGVVRGSDDAPPRHVSAQVLRIAFAYDRARRAPIMGLPGSSVDDLRRATRALRESARMLALPHAGEERAFIRESLFPLSFLDALAEAEEKRRVFLDAPSPLSLRDYERALYAGALALRDNADAFREALTRYVDRNKRYGFADGTTDVAHISRAIDHIERSAQERTLDIARESACSKGLISLCEKAVAGTEVVEWISASTPRVLALPPHAAENRSALIESGFLDADAEVLALNASECALSKGPIYIALSRSRHPFAPKILDELVFFDLTKRGGAVRLLFEDELRASALPYLYQSTINPYICLSAARELARLTTMLAVRDALAEPLIGDMDALAALERTVADREAVLSEEAVVSYVQALKTEMESLGEAGFVGAYGERGAAMAHEIVAMWTAQSGGAERLVEAVSELNAFSLRHSEYTLEDLILSRSMFLLTFMTFNPLIVEPLSEIRVSRERIPSLTPLTLPRDDIRTILEQTSRTNLGLPPR